MNALAWCFGLMLFVLPLAHTRAAQTGLMGLCVLLFVIWVLRSGYRVFANLPRPLAYPLVIWCAVTTVSCAWSQEPLLSLSLVAQNIWLPTLFFLLAYVLGARRESLAVVVPGACLGLFVVGCAALAAAVLRRADILQGGFGPGYREHFLMRWYPGPGLASTFALLALPFVYWVFRDRVLPKWILALLGVLVFIGAVSMNRIFWPVLVLSCFALLMGYAHKRQHYCKSAKFWVLVVLALLLGFALLLAATIMRNNLDFASWFWVIKNKLLADPRLAIWNIWVSIGMDQHPWLGTGFGKDVAHNTYKQLLDLKFVPGTDFAGKAHPHNVFLSTWIQMGVAGVVSLLVLIWGMLTAALRLSRSSPGARHAAAALVALVVAMLFKNMTDDFYDRLMGVLFWSYFGILLGFASLQNRLQHDTSSAQ
ncbi:O-antigen ligase family protein [Uliginosibacterium gangwonense]|uniref:O-antigen ligase family protein n=1 Tax=Uliginosibacterium gangwonense TaxID=392736 RepID=UPI000366266B|nr:O-antigen ligase family protein [Uliginosibacterium gangwonense]